MTISFADGLFWLSVACCALAQSLILRSVGGAHHAPGSAPGMPRQRGAVEMLWAVLPAIGLAVLLVFTWRAVRASQSQDGRPAAVVVGRSGTAR
jgi:heme/copper-type cytochrome/quinol oxidase subunit 2